MINSIKRIPENPMPPNPHDIKIVPENQAHRIQRNIKAVQVVHPVPGKKVTNPDQAVHPAREKVV